MDKKAMYKLSYGLYVVTTRNAEKANGCIVNTAIQAASTPNQICVCINKANYTHDMLLKTGADHPAAAGVPGQIGQPYPVDHHCRHGGLESDPPQIRQRHPGSVRFPPHLGGWPRHPQPALRRCVGRCGAKP